MYVNTNIFFQENILVKHIRLVAVTSGVLDGHIECGCSGLDK